MRVYDLSKFTAILGAVEIGARGRPEGEALVTIEKLKEDYTYVEGTDGEVTRMPTGSNVYRVTFRLLQSSPDNAKLTAIRNAGLAAANGVDILPLVLSDGSGADVFTSPEAFIEKPPTVGYAQAAEVREWPIIAANGLLILGGN
jgi:hypothetical protein